VADKLAAMRGPGETYSHVIMRLAAGERLSVKLSSEPWRALTPINAQGRQ
jgi:hypothetical protein